MAGMLFDEIVKIEKMNPYHGRDGRFTTAQAATSFTYKPGASTAHDRAIEREKERNGETRSFKGTLYHGSPATDIEEFDMNRAGQNTSSGEKLLFFTDSKQMAEDFSYERLEGSSKFFQRRGEKGRVYEVDVEMKNALDLRNLSEKDIGNLMKLDVEGILTKEIAVELSGKNNQLLKTYLNLTAASLSELGYDGLIANTGKVGHNSVEYAVVDGKQAKIRKGLSKNFDEILKYNDKHDPKTGQFASKNGGGGGAAANTDYQGSKFSRAAGRGQTADAMASQIDKLSENVKNANPEAIKQIQTAAGDPDAKVTIYRATVGDTINSGDWVFLDRQQADKWTKTHFGTPKPGVKVLSMEVSAKEVDWTGKNLEFAYTPNDGIGKMSDEIVEKINSEDSEERDMIVQKEKMQTVFDILEEVEGVAKFNPYHDRLGRFASAHGGGAAVAVAGHNGVTTKEQDAAYMAAVEAGDMETAQRMVIETAKAVGAQTFANPDTTAYSIRRGPEPQETVKTYKTFFVDNEGNPSALFVEGTDRLPVGVWLDAKDAYHFQADNGKMYTPSRKNPNSDGSGKTGAAVKIPNDQVRQELIDQGFLPPGSTAKDVTALAYRPGWHAGDLPFFPQGGKQGNPEFNESGKPNKRYDPSKPTTNYQNIHRWNQVVFECEMAADIDYTKSTSIKSGPNKGKIKYTDMQEMPTDGYYKFATNPMTNSNSLGNWYISGSLKINRALTQKECDDILAKNGFKPQEWEGGKLDLGKLNYNPNKTDRGTKLLDPVTYDNNGKVIPLSQRFDNSSDDVRKSADETVCTIYKTDEDKRLVFGWASISYTVDGEQLEDLQKDMIDPDDLEEAVYDYVLNFRDTGEEHIPTMRKKGKLVESCVLTEEKQRAMGIPAGTLPIGWWIGFKIEDDDAWERVKNGTYRMFSIEGKANREPVEKSHEEEREEKVAKTFNEILGVHSTTRTIEKAHPDRFDHIVEVEKSDDFDHLVEVEKFNPYHDSRGRFASANSFSTYTGKPGRNYGIGDTRDALNERDKKTGELKDNSLRAHMDADGNLSPERAAVHRQIIDDILKGKVPVDGQAKMTMLGGGPASGKSSVMSTDTSKDKHSVTINPDDIKEMLPGYKEMAAKSEEAAGFYHEESSMIAKQLTSVVYGENYNALIDGTGDGSVESVMKKVNGAKAAGYSVEAKYVSVDTETAVARNQKRYDDAVANGQTPRKPDPDLVRNTHALVSDISVACAKEFDSIEIWDNNGARGQQKLIATGGSGKNLTAVPGQEEAFSRYLAKGTRGLDGFITLPNGQVIPAE